MTKEEAFEEINKTQDFYVDELIKLISSPDYSSNKSLNFTSATGTGKTKMMSKLINRLPEYYFIITTLSKGQLHLQIRNSLLKDCNQTNFVVYGSADYRINSVLEAEDIIGAIPTNTKCIWLRDEGHIKTNRYDELLADVCYKVINFSATNTYSDIQCNFAQTMMLRTVNQTTGTPKEAIIKLIEIKKAHKDVTNYNPCAIFRCVNDEVLYKEIVKLCKKNNLQYIDITEDPFVMAELCEDDNPYDVIINKYKLVEGIDIRRAHVLFMDNQPKNVATTIQVIGRCRRNALLYRDDIDILAAENQSLLKQTRECFVYYNVESMHVDSDENGELQYAFCNHISCEALKVGSCIDVVDGQLANGLYVIELNGQTGRFNVVTDENTGFNVIKQDTPYYDELSKHVDRQYVYTKNRKIQYSNVKKLPTYDKDGKLYYCLSDYQKKEQIKIDFPEEVISYFEDRYSKYTTEYLLSQLKNSTIDVFMGKIPTYSVTTFSKYVNEYLHNNKTKDEVIVTYLTNLENTIVNICGFDFVLKDICSENEIVLLAYFCIKRRELYALEGIEESYTLDGIIKYVNQYAELRANYFCYNHFQEQSIDLVFDGIPDITELPTNIEKIKVFVQEYLKANIKIIRNRKFYNLLISIAETPQGWCTDSCFKEIKGSCSKNELLLIQYCCIKEKELGKSNEEIVEYLKKIVTLKQNFHKIVYPESERITYILLANNIRYVVSTGKQIKPINFFVHFEYPKKMVVDKDDIDNLFAEYESLIEISRDSSVILQLEDFVESVRNTMLLTYEEIKHGILHKASYDFSALFEPLDDEEQFYTRNGYMGFETGVPASVIDNMHIYQPYDIIVNDRESAIVGTDLMRQVRFDAEVFWVESSSITSKIGRYTKLNTFISRKYSNELEQAKSQYFRGKNNFKLATRFNSMIGYCVEYYSKYLLFGRVYLVEYINTVEKEAYKQNIIIDTNEELPDFFIIRACILKYKQLMVRCFGKNVTKVIKSATIEYLSENEYFVNLVVELGRRTASYVKEALYKGVEPKDNVDPNLAIQHISGLADFITRDTILDVKVRNYIDEKSVRQVLAYHYLSTKRSDLQIKRVIVYDAVSDKAISIDIANNNM